MVCGAADEETFATLVERHAPMVWGVCRRVLHNHHDAEDAFQATFLVLARRAASVVPREMLANWLFGVACDRRRLKARGLAARNDYRERQVAALPERAAEERGCWDDLVPILDRELTRLPNKYRAVVVLCDLEGKTRKESGRRAGVPEGSVAGWLARARAAAGTTARPDRGPWYRGSCWRPCCRARSLPPQTRRPHWRLRPRHFADKADWRRPARFLLRGFSLGRKGDDDDVPGEGQSRGGRGAGCRCIGWDCRAGAQLPRPGIRGRRIRRREMAGPGVG